MGNPVPIQCVVKSRNDNHTSSYLKIMCDCRSNGDEFYTVCMMLTRNPTHNYSSDSTS
ncbi:hypothetical protein BACCAP_03337 [Pseudoflavonifractor capillosus ATCC 29799]|uniref:Uncharacterized protein n=1 Tax=Pseudoflavonifractor capillosus ATCC 29799 TaxID=411467 RepID=A6NYN6_9FIRM|nr:hypothetical protein BACCAP_03337 [Pseudoflavonifractor capillosus ATCC 29799]